MIKINTVCLLEYVDTNNQSVDTLFIDLADSGCGASQQADIAAKEDLFSQSLSRFLVYIKRFCHVSPVNRLIIINLALCFENVDDNVGGGIATTDDGIRLSCEEAGKGGDHRSWEPRDPRAKPAEIMKTS